MSGDEAPQHLLLLYTGGLRGDLRLLPRLHTFIRSVKGSFNSPSLLLDLGDSCTPESWHCAATGGRSMLIALDALGCHAARVEGLDNAARERLNDNLMGMALVDALHPWHDTERGISVTAQQPDPAARLSILLTPTNVTQQHGTTLWLAGVRAGQLGIAQVSLTKPGVHLLSSQIVPMPDDTLPDPTLAGVVDFIEGEARHFQRRGHQPS